MRHHVAVYHATSARPRLSRGMAFRDGLSRKCATVASFTGPIHSPVYAASEQGPAAFDRAVAVLEWWFPAGCAGGHREVECRLQVHITAHEEVVWCASDFCLQVPHDPTSFAARILCLPVLPSLRISSPVSTVKPVSTINGCTFSPTCRRIQRESVQSSVRRPRLL